MTRVYIFVQDMRKGQGCNQCTHPACKHSLNSLGVGECFECDSGVLVLDASSAPKWKLACNKCNLVVALFENAHKVMMIPHLTLRLMVWEIRLLSWICTSNGGCRREVKSPKHWSLLITFLFLVTAMLLFVRSNQEQLYVLIAQKIREK